MREFGQFLLRGVGRILALIGALAAGWVVLGSFIADYLINIGFTTGGLMWSPETLGCATGATILVVALVLGWVRGLKHAAAALIGLACFALAWVSLGELYTDLLKKLTLDTPLPWDEGYTGRIFAAGVVIVGFGFGITRGPKWVLIVSLFLLAAAIFVVRVDFTMSNLERGMTPSFIASRLAIEQRRDARNNSEAIKDAKENVRTAKTHRWARENNAQLAKLRRQNEAVYKSEMDLLEAERLASENDYLSMPFDDRLSLAFRTAFGAAFTEAAKSELLIVAAYLSGLVLSGGGAAENRAPASTPPPRQAKAKPSGKSGPRGNPKSSSQPQASPSRPARGTAQRRATRSGRGGPRRNRAQNGNALTGHHSGVEGVVLDELNDAARDGLDVDAGTWRGRPLTHTPSSRRVVAGGQRRSVRWPTVQDDAGKRLFIGQAAANRLVA